MAKVSSSGNDPVPRRTTRTTRSQSREVSEAPSSTTTSPRKQHKGRRARSAVKEQGCNGMSVQPSLTTESDLATVEEDEDAAPIPQSTSGNLAIEQQRALAEEVDEEEIPPAATTRRISTHSGYSGTTAKTSFSQEQIAELDADIMVDDLPIAASTADELAKHFLPNDRKALHVIWKEIRTPTSRYRKLYRTRAATFDLCCQSFGQQDYIQPSFVLRALFGVASANDVPAEPWRPDSMIYRINLIRMMRNVLIKSPNPVDFMNHDLDDLVILDDFFPNAIAGSLFDEETLKMCLAIQTQVALHRLTFHQSDPTFSANDTISNVFLSVNEDDDLVYKHVDALELAVSNKDQSDVRNKLINERIHELRSAFQSPHEYAIATLRTHYSWDSFVDQLFTYYQVRKQQLDQDVANAGGTDLITVNLSKEVRRQSDARAAASKRESLVKAGSTPRKSVGKGAIARLKAREQERRQSEQEVPQLAVRTNNTQDLDEDNSQPPVDVYHDDFAHVDDVVIEPQRQSSEAGKQRGVVNRSEAFESRGLQEASAPMSRERARFTDAQPNAVRVEWDESSQATQEQATAQKSRQSLRNSSSRQHPHVNANKRTIDNVEEDGPEKEFDPTQDEGFQTDTHGAVGANERRTQAAALTARAAMRPSNATHVATAHLESSRERSASPAKRQRRNPGSAIPLSTMVNDDDELPSSISFEQAKILAKQNRIHFKPNKGPQQRQAWTPAEEEALIDLIHDHGTGGIQYALLKTVDASAGQDARLGRRNAEQLRFKARNMKQTFLRSAVSCLIISDVYVLTCFHRSREALPRNFEHIVLDKKAIDDLQARGIPYEQDRIRAATEA
nr:hypothetical protein CFP56_16203 [Quercus suber]